MISNSARMKLTTNLRQSVLPLKPMPTANHMGHFFNCLPQCTTPF